MSRSGPPLRIVGLESYDFGSHQAVRESISRHSRHHWRWFTRPGRGWKWRMRLAAVELVDAATAAGGFDEPIDAILTTSLLGAADLRALLPPSLRQTPMVLYMHENQAAYPASQLAADPRDVHFALTNLTSVLAADLVLWNSRWNRDSFFDQMGRILRQASAVEIHGWEKRVDEKSRVIWPPVEAPPAAIRRDRSVADEEALHNATRVVWPHRWEHDKGPDELLELALRYSDSHNLRWTILGWRFPTVPEALLEFEKRLGPRIDHMGYEPDRMRYWERLARCDWVLSTATHEFFGLAVAEALLAGCLPWLPDRLSYTELLPPEARGLSPAHPPSDEARVRDALRHRLEATVAPNAVAAIDEAIVGVVGSLRA